MSILLVCATVDCDGCGFRFHVDLDLAAMRPKGWALHDEVEDVIRGGHSEDADNCGVIEKMHLCGACMSGANTVLPEEEEYAPKVLIVAALEAAGKTPHVAHFNRFLLPVEIEIPAGYDAALEDMKRLVITPRPRRRL